MTTSAFFPIGTGGRFPDNGMLNNYAYDQRVTQNDMLAIGMKIMHQQKAYVREENLLGQGVYTWEPDFIAMIDQSFADGIKGNFSKDQLALFNQYLEYIRNGLTATTPEAVIALDGYLGSR